MKVLIYEKLNGKYECRKIQNSSSEEILLTVNEPINGILKLGEESVRMKKGIAHIYSCKLTDGVIKPLLFTADGVFEFESFIFKDGAIRTLDPDGEYIRTLSKKCEGLAQAVLALEEKISRICEKIENITII